MKYKITKEGLCIESETAWDNFILGQVVASSVYTHTRTIDISPSIPGKDPKLVSVEIKLNDILKELINPKEE